MDVSGLSLICRAFSSSFLPIGTLEIPKLKQWFLRFYSHPSYATSSGHHWCFQQCERTHQTLHRIFLRTLHRTLCQTSWQSIFEEAIMLSIVITSQTGPLVTWVGHGHQVSLIPSSLRLGAAKAGTRLKIQPCTCLTVSPKSRISFAAWKKLSEIGRRDATDREMNHA